MLAGGREGDTTRYDVRQFLQEAPADLLRAFLASIGLGDNIDWSTAEQSLTQDVFTAIGDAPEKAHRQVHSAFRLIHKLADEDGVATILAEIRRRHSGRKTLSAFEQHLTPTGRAFWTYLNEPEIFAVCYRFRSADMIRRWHRVCARPARPFAPMKDSTVRLQDDLRGYYQEYQGRGHDCVVQTYPRDSRRYWFACLQDYAEEVLLCDEHHQFHLNNLEMAFEIIFIYDDDAGTLAIATDGDLQHVMDLQCIFGRAVFGEELTGAVTGEEFRIQRLLDRRYPLPLLPEDRVESVSVQSIGITFLGQRGSGIRVNAVRNGDSQRVYEMLDKVLSGFNVPPDLVTVTQVELCFTLRPEDGIQQKPRVVRLTPRSCNCTRSPWEEEIRQLLRRWGIYDTSSCDNTAAGD